ncbi:MAG: sortase [Anaerolineae bacterium]|nr:sortase [Anaerolineae bacterium]
MTSKKATQNQWKWFIGLLLVGVTAGAGIWLLRFGPPSQEDESLPPMAAPPATNSPQPTEEVNAAAAYPQIFVAAAGVNESIIESALEEDGWRVNHLENRVGHLQGTSWLGKPGNIVLAGHVELRNGTPGVFSRIDELKPGDVVTLSENGTSYDYRVTEVKVVEADDLSVVYPTPVERVTLITCTGYDFLTNTYNQRIVVVAER